MDHGYIIKNNIADLYLMGHLSDEESEQFELHFADCQRCIGQLEISRSLMHELQVLRDDSVWEDDAPPIAGPFGHLARLSPPVQAAILTFALILLLAPVALLVIRANRLEDELIQAKRRIQIGEENSGHPFEKDTENRNANKQPDSVKDSQTTAHNERQSKSEQEALAHARPQVNTSVFILSSARGAPSNNLQALNEFVISEGSRSFVLSVDLEEEPQYKTYHVAVAGKNRRVIWQARNLAPDAHNSLVITFPGDFFKDGNYTLSLNGVDQDGKLVKVSDYSFLISKKNSP